MTVYVLIREDQSEHGFVDASVVEAREQGLLVCGDPGTEPEWEVSWNIEPHALR
jgi:hypothetical protein